jgi:hypothetical protein
VAAGGEFHAELGGDDAGAAVGGVAGYADAHRVRFESPSNLMKAGTIQQNQAAQDNKKDNKRKHGSQDRPVRGELQRLVAGC